MMVLMRCSLAAVLHASLGMFFVRLTPLIGMWYAGAHRAPEMAELVKEYYQGLERAGVDLIMHFSSAGLPSKYGAWGLIEATDQNPADAPKQVGLFAYLESTAQCAFPNATGCEHASQCSGQGFCVDGRCSCFYGFSGDDCSESHFTEHFECGYKCNFDQGVCRPYRTQGLERYWRCECGNGYWGATCSRFECQIGVITMACASILMFAAAFVGTQVTDANTTAAVMAMGSVTKRAHARVTMAGGGVQAVRRVSGIAVAMSASGLGSAGARPARRALASRAGVCAGLDLPGMTVHSQSPNPTMALRSE